MSAIKRIEELYGEEVRKFDRVMSADARLRAIERYLEELSSQQTRDDVTHEVERYQAGFRVATERANLALDPFNDCGESKPPTEQPGKFIYGLRYYAGMLADDDGWGHVLGHVRELCAEFEQATKARSDEAQSQISPGPLPVPTEQVTTAPPETSLENVSRDGGLDARLGPGEDDGGDPFSMAELRGLIGPRAGDKRYSLTLDGKQIGELLSEALAKESDHRAQQMKARVYGEMAYKWRKRCIDAGLSHNEDRILADEWQAKDNEISEAREDL